jgi:hypothetical protein
MNGSVRGNSSDPHELLSNIGQAATQNRVMEYMASGHAPVIKSASGMVGDDSNSTIRNHTRKSLMGSDIDISGIGKGTSALTNSRTAAQGGIYPPKLESAFGSGIGSISGLNMDEDENSQWKNSSNFLKNRNKS